MKIADCFNAQCARQSESKSFHIPYFSKSFCLLRAHTSRALWLSVSASRLCNFAIVSTKNVSKKNIKIKSQWIERIVFIQWMANQCWFSSNINAIIRVRCTQLANASKSMQNGRYNCCAYTHRAHTNDRATVCLMRSQLIALTAVKETYMHFLFHRHSIRTYILTLFTHQPTANDFERALWPTIFWTEKRDIYIYISFPFSVAKIANGALCVRVRGLHSRGVDESGASKNLEKKKNFSLFSWTNTTGKNHIRGNRKLRHACTKWKWNRHAPISVDTFATGPDDGTWQHRRHLDRACNDNNSDFRCDAIFTKNLRLFSFSLIYAKQFLFLFLSPFGGK